MDFTREPIIETVITPREGYRLVVRSSKGAGSEEHFVDALEVVSFGSGVFFRSLERPKPFIVPVADYEVLEVREPRMVLKTPQEQAQKQASQKQKIEPQQKIEIAPISTEGQPQAGAPQESKQDRNSRRDRRRGFRKRRGGQEGQRADGASPEEMPKSEEEAMLPSEEGGEESKIPTSAPMLSSILPPPTKLIRDDLKRLREDYKGAFYINEDKDTLSDDDDAQLASLGTTSTEEELSFREAPYDVTEEDIRMTEGGDSEVPQESSFRQDSVKEEANSGTPTDVQ